MVDLRKAIALNASYAPACMWYPGELYSPGRRDEALQAIEQAWALDPRSVITQLNLGCLLEDGGRLEEALAAYQQAVAIDPSQPRAYTFIANLQFTTKGRHDTAMPHLEKAAELDPGDIIAPAFQGWGYLNLGDDARAEHLLDRALQLNPGAAKVLGWMATLHLYRGEPERARDYARQSFAIGPREGWSLKLLRNAELAARNPSAARVVCASVPGAPGRGSAKARRGEFPRRGGSCARVAAGWRARTHRSLARSQ